MSTGQSRFAREFTIWVCPVCDFYDADPVQRRGPDTRHEPKRCFPCADKAVKAIDYRKINPSARASYRDRARYSAPLMEATKVRRSA